MSATFVNQAFCEDCQTEGNERQKQKPCKITQETLLSQGIKLGKACPECNHPVGSHPNQAVQTAILAAQAKAQAESQTQGTSGQSGVQSLAIGLEEVSLQGTQFQLDQDVNINVLHHDDRNESMGNAVKVLLEKDRVRNYTDVKHAIHQTLGNMESRAVERVWQADTSPDGSIKRSRNVADMNPEQFKQAISSETNDAALFLWYDQNASPSASPRSGSPSEVPRDFVLCTPQPQTPTIYSETHDPVVLEEIGLNFPLLDRDDELGEVLKGLDASFSTRGEEPARDVPIYCIGGVSGSGKTRFAREIAPCFNKLNKSNKRALFCKFICSEHQKENSNTVFEEICTEMLDDLLKRSGHEDKYSAIVSSSEWKHNSLKYILDLSQVKEYKTAVVVNIDEAHRIPKSLLQKIIKALTKTTSTERSAHFWPVATGLDLRNFMDAQRQSDLPLAVKTLQPVRNLDRALLHTLDIQSDIIHCEHEFKALMVSLDGVPRLLWAAIAAFANVSSQTQSTVSAGFGTISVNFKTVFQFLREADKIKYKTIYSQILGLIHGNQSYFLSLNSMVSWTNYVDVLSCIVAGCPVVLEDKLGKETVSNIAARGWALLHPLPGNLSHFVMTLPLLYLHAFDLNTWQATSEVKNAVDILRTPSRGLSESDAEKLDINILDFRARAYRALGRKNISLSELLGGVTISKEFKFNVSLELGMMSGQILDESELTVVSDFLESSTDEAILAFTSKNKASYADSGIIFRKSQVAAATEVITVPKQIGTRASSADEYSPSHPEAFSVLVQSKRYLSTSSNITELLALNEFNKVKNTFSVSRLAFVIVSDKKNFEIMKNDSLRQHCIMITGNDLELFLGSMIYSRRRAAANVARTTLKTPEFDID